MKIIVLVQILIAFYIFAPVSAERDKIIVGGIFHGDDIISQTAFKYAVNWINSRMLPFEIVPKTFNISRIESFQAQKTVCELMSTGIDAIFGPNSIETSRVVSSFANKYEFPHIIYHWKTKPLHHRNSVDKTMTLNLYPDSATLSEAFADIIDEFGWTSYAIIYESNENLIKLKNVLQNHDGSEKSAIAWQLTEDYLTVLKHVKTRFFVKIIVDVSTDKIIPLLKAAEGLNMLTEYYSYFIMNLDTHNLEKEINEIKNVSSESMMANITSVQLIDKEGEEMKISMKIWNQPENRTPMNESTLPLEAALIHDAVQFYANGLHVYSGGRKMPPRVKQSCDSTPRKNSGYELVKFLKNRDFEGISGRVRLNNEDIHKGTRSQFLLTILELTNGSFTKIGKWNLLEKIHDLRDAQTSDTQIALAIEKKHFKIAVKIEEPFLMKREKENENDPDFEGNNRYEGYIVDLLVRLRNILHFQYTLELAGDGKNGNLDPKTGEWDGLVRVLLDGKADLAAADISITYDRKTAVEFTVPFMNLGIQILMKVEDPKENDYFSFRKPFEPKVWLYTTIAFFSVSLMVFILSRINVRDWEPGHPCDKDSEEVESIWNITNCVWLAMGSIMGQGCDILPKGSPTRIVTATWWFFALIMLASYTANLAAFLTTEAMTDIIDNAEELVKQTKVKYGTVQGGATMKFFETSNYSTYQRMWAAMENAGGSVFMISNKQGVNKVLKGNYAFMMESVPLEYEWNQKCELRKVGGLLDTKGYGIALPITSPYRKKFSEAILKLSENGDLNKLKDTWWKPSYRKTVLNCPEGEEDTGPSRLGIENVGGVFIVLGLGLIFAFFVAIGEFLMNVGKIAIAEKISHWDAFKSELSFAFNIFNVTKPVRTGSSEAIISRRSTPPRSLKSRSRYGSESRILKNKTNRSLDFEDLHARNAKSMLNLR